MTDHDLVRLGSEGPVHEPTHHARTRAKIKAVVAPGATVAVTRARLLPSDSASRKMIPMAAGLLDYFPDALAAVANVSFIGNQQHNPGQHLHWARGKSMDHDDTIIRHFVERGALDTDGVRHSAKLAWRALALLQQELEREFNLPLPRGASQE